MSTVATPVFTPSAGMYVTDGKSLFQVVRVVGCDYYLDNVSAPTDNPTLVVILEAEFAADCWRAVEAGA